MRRTYRSALLALAVALCACGTDTHGADVDKYTIDSKAVGRKLDQRLVLPDDPSGALVVMLHGRTGNEDSTASEPFYAALADLGDDAPAVVFPAGGDHSSWHDRRGGDWGSYVVDEVIPRALKESGADPRRVAIGGISMGGFGALDVARLHPGSFCAVGGHSAAVWTEGGLSAPGAFDDANDFARHDLVAAARAGTFTRPRHIWLDRGDHDPFVPGVDALAAALGVKVHSYPGEHVGEYWDAHWDEYLRFYARACA